MDRFNVIQYKEYADGPSLFAIKKFGNLNTKVRPLAEGVSLEGAICKYQQFKHREGLEVDNWYCTIKIEYCTDDLNG